MADVIDTLLQRLRALMPDASEETVRQLEVETRAEWGGCETYIAKRPALQRAHAVGKRLQSGGTIQQAMDVAGVGRSQTYRILSTPIRKLRR